MARKATRRQLLQGGGLVAASAIIPATAVAAPPDAANIYHSLGVRPLINARGTVTIVGATRALPEVKKAMDEATRHFVQLDELAEGVGRKLAELTASEWGAVTAGCAAALTLATAACVTGGDPDKMAQLPDLTGLKDEVIMPSYSRVAYDHGVRAVGVRILEVRDQQELEAAMGPRTAMVFVVASGTSERGPLSLREIAAAAKPRGVPILVDAAADELRRPNPYIEQGATLVAYSGGKCLRGPQCAGLLIGRKDLVQAAWISGAPHHGFARGYKVGREEILGMVAAVESWWKRDHEAEWRKWNSWLEHIAARLSKIEGVKTRIVEPQGLSNRTPTLNVEWHPAKIKLTGYDVENLLWEGEPRVAVSGAGSFLPFPPNMRPNISIIPYQLEAGEEKIVAERVHAVLSNPPNRQKPVQPPATNLSGQWDVHITFVAGSADQTFVLEQKGNDLVGTHYASFAQRDASGTINANEILLRSSYTRKGVRLNFEFTGTVTGDSMQGEVSLGEYGKARWTAKRHGYQPAGARRA